MNTVNFDYAINCSFRFVHCPCRNSEYLRVWLSRGRVMSVFCNNFREMRFMFLLVLRMSGIAWTCIRWKDEKTITKTAVTVSLKHPCATLDYDAFKGNNHLLSPCQSSTSEIYRLMSSFRDCEKFNHLLSYGGRFSAMSHAERCDSQVGGHRRRV